MVICAWVGSAGGEQVASGTKARMARDSQNGLMTRDQPRWRTTLRDARRSGPADRSLMLPWLSNPGRGECRSRLASSIVPSLQPSGNMVERSLLCDVSQDFVTLACDAVSPVPDQLPRFTVLALGSEYVSCYSLGTGLLNHLLRAFLPPR